MVCCKTGQAETCWDGQKAVAEHQLQWERAPTVRAESQVAL